MTTHDRVCKAHSVLKSEEGTLPFEFYGSGALAGPARWDADHALARGRTRPQ